jgi:hypothetical protein
MKVLPVAAGAGVNVPARASKAPPVPDPLVQTPPGCSPAIRLKRLMAAVLLSQTATLPSLPALGCEFIFTVTSLISSTHGKTPGTVYLKVLVVDPTPGVKVAVPALKTPALPPVLVHVPPLCSPVIRLKRFMATVLLSQTVTIASVPATG